jgi:type I restriction-modification system DNA methylase subunit
MLYKISPAVEQFFETAKPKERVAATIAAIKEARAKKPNPDIVARASGWGSIKSVIWDDDKHPILKAEMEELLTDYEKECAKTGTFWSFHTSFEVIRYIWELVQKTGFDGGRIIDAGCGSGHFFGCIPDFGDASELWGVEIDPTPYKICEALYGNQVNIANVDFRKFKMPKGYFDLMIGNVPFGDAKIYDDSVYRGGLSIHNYFLAKGIALVRPGGLIAIVTSSFSMDNRDDTFRNWLATQADLIDITPLTDTTFKSFANTEVCADILIFKKLKDKRRVDWLPSDCHWTKTVEVQIDGEEVRMNQAIAEAYSAI